MAQPNFQYEKRQKELAKKRKKEEKKQRKLDEAKTQASETPQVDSDQPADSGAAD